MRPSDKQYLTLQEAADYLSKQLGETITVRDILYLGENGELPIGAFRHGRTVIPGEPEVVYLPKFIIPTFDPVRNDNPNFTLMVGYTNPDDAMADVPSEFTGADGQECVDSIDKLVTPIEYLKKYLSNGIEEEWNPPVKENFKTLEAQNRWSIICNIYVQVKNDNPEDKTVALSRETQRRAALKGITLSASTIRKQIQKLFRNSPKTPIKSPKI